MIRPINLDNLFSDRSDLYAAARPHYPHALFEYIANLCNAHDNAWDCATGSGQAARSLTSYFAMIQATDVSEAQIQNAVQHPQIHYSIQRAEKTSFSKHEFDLITVAQALHWFDLPLFWQEVNRVLKPGGILAVWGYNWPKISPQIDQELEASIYQIIRPYWASANQILWDEYNTIEFPMPLLTTPAFSLRSNWNLDQLFTYLQTWSAARRCIAAEGQDFIKEAQKNMHQFWQGSDQVQTITMELCLKVGRKIN